MCRLKRIVTVSVCCGLGILMLVSCSKKNEKTQETIHDETEKSTVADYEEEIRSHYILQKECEAQIRLIVLSNLQRASYIKIETDDSEVDYFKMIADDVVDNTIENPILSEGTKRAIEAIGEEKTVEDIINETVFGLADGAKKEVTSSVKEMLLGDLEPIIDCQLFDEAEWIKEFLDVDDTPVGLLTGMVDRQQKDVEMLLAIVNKENYQPGDILFLSGVYMRICSRQEEIISAGGRAEILGQQEELGELIEIWEKEIGSIYRCYLLMEGTEQAAGTQEDDWNLYQKYVEYRIGALPACYDVNGYREQQKYTEQSGMLSSKLFGDLLGAMTKEDLENNQKTVQENRIRFSTKLESAMEDSYYQMCQAKGKLDVLYYAVNTAPDDKGRINPKNAGLAETLQDYVNAMDRYAFDFKTSALFWANITSGYDSQFVTGLQQDVQMMYQQLQNGVDDGCVIEGYDADEMQQRYIRMVDHYMEYLNYSMLFSNYEPAYGNVHSVTAYSVGTFDVYPKDQINAPLILAEEQMSTNYHKSKYLWVYDTEGNPIFVQNQFGQTYILDGQVIKFTGESEEIGDRIKENADRIIQDIITGNIGRAYKNYAM